jgi:hypothetical protein
VTTPVVGLTILFETHAADVVIAEQTSGIGIHPAAELLTVHELK